MTVEAPRGGGQEAFQEDEEGPLASTALMVAVGCMALAKVMDTTVVAAREVWLVEALRGVGTKAVGNMVVSVESEIAGGVAIREGPSEAVCTVVVMVGTADVAAPGAAKVAALLAAVVVPRGVAASVAMSGGAKAAERVVQMADSMGGA